MSEPKTTKEEDQEVERQEQLDDLLPAIADLDTLAAELEQRTSNNQEVTQADIATYQQQSVHLRHLLAEAGADLHEIGTHPRPFQPVTPEKTPERQQDIEEEVDL